MAKISSLTLLGAAPADNDEFVILDVSDTTQGAGGSTKGLVASRVARTGAANTFTSRQTIAANMTGPGLIVSNTGAAVGLDLCNDTNAVLDFRNASGTVLDARVQYATDALIFTTRTVSDVPVAAARIDANQYLLIGYTTSNGAFRLQVNSQIYATNATVATSDERVKENVETLADGLAAVMALRPVVFDFVEHDVHNFSRDRQIGFIAQEIETALADDDYLRCIVPETQNEDQLKGVAGDKLVALLVRAVQQQQAMIEALTARVTALEGA